jgi:protein tyrosine/serine phosphatase
MIDTEFERVLPFSGIHNFRDYGGYAVAGGGRVVRGKLFRSSQHYDATPADLDRVGALELRTVIDLRGGGERANAPCPRPINFKATIIATDNETASLAPHIEAGTLGNSAEVMHQRMIQVYEGIAFRDELSRLISRYFAALAASDSPSLIHCLAGKDRTGIAVALLHDLLGVHYDDIMADYLLTNTAGNAEARIAAGARSLNRREGRGLDDAAMRVLMAVHPDYLHTAFAAIKARHGSVEAYIRDHLGVDAARAAAIRAHHLV